MNKHYSFFLVVSLMTSILAHAQRPKVGLVLSGGGAKGMAHIGVIQILDSLEIPIDLVTGTSMGSIVGGLYSIGYTGDQIEREVVDVNWDDLMRDQPLREDRTLDDKFIQDVTLLSLDLDGVKVSLPSGLRRGQKIYNKFVSLTIGYNQDLDFNSFPRPFACVAADIKNSQQVVLRKGSLPKAIRASMAIPTFFDPVEYNDMLLVDGGVTNNFPTDIARDMGADRIIGVFLAAMGRDTANFNMGKVLERTSMIVNNSSLEARKSVCDVVVEPDVAHFSTLGFDQNEALIREGKRAARAMIPQLLELKKELEGRAYHEWKYDQRDSVYISSLQLRGLNDIPDDIFRRILGVEEGHTYGVSEVEDRITNIYGLGFFRYINYSFLPEENGYALQLEMHEGSQLTNLRLGVHYDTDFGMRVFTGFYRKNLIYPGSKGNLNLIIGEKPRVDLNLIMPVSLKWVGGVRSSLIYNPIDLYLLGDYEGTLRNLNWNSGIYFQTFLDPSWTFGFAGEYVYGAFNFGRIPLLNLFAKALEVDPVDRSHHLNAMTYFRFDRLDDFHYPKKGVKIDLEGRSVWTTSEGTFSEKYSEQFFTIRGHLRGAISPTSWWTMVPEFNSVLTLGGEPTSTYSAQLGGLGRNYYNNQIWFAGYHYYELGAKSQDQSNNNNSQAATIALEQRFKIIDNLYFSAIGNYGWMDAPESGVFTNPIDISGFALKASYRSFLGPLEVSVHKSFDRSLWLGYLNLGFWF